MQLDSNGARASGPAEGTSESGATASGQSSSGGAAAATPSGSGRGGGAGAGPSTEGLPQGWSLQVYVVYGTITKLLLQGH